MLSCRWHRYKDWFYGDQRGPAHNHMKQAMLEASERDTALIFRTLHNTARVFRNAAASEVVEIKARDADTIFDDIAHLVAGTRGRATMADGGVWTVGQVITSSMTFQAVKNFSTVLLMTQKKFFKGA